MRNLVTVEWVVSRDTAGLVSDSTSLEDAITRVSYDLCGRVGHDWGDSTAATETLDGVRSPSLSLAGKTQYPLRTLDMIQVDDTELTITSDYLIQYSNRHIGNLIDKLRLKGSTFYGYQVDITGDWGWSSVPDDVMEAVYRLLVLEITGSPYGARKSTASMVYGSNQGVKRLKHPDGVEVEFNSASISVSGSDLAETTGDDFADEVVTRYKWREIGGVV